MESGGLYSELKRNRRSIYQQDSKYLKKENINMYGPNNRGWKTQTS